MSCNYDDVKNNCKGVIFMTDEMAELPAFSNFDVVLIDDADMFFEFITSGRMKHLKENAQVMFEKDYLIS